MIPDEEAKDEQPAKADPSPSQQVIGQYWVTGWQRWYLVVFAVTWLLLGILQLQRQHAWWGLVFAAFWAALAVVTWRLPKVVISDQGVTYLTRRIIPWSQVADVVARPRVPGRRWRLRVPELVLSDGRRRSLEHLNDTQVEGLRALAREHGAPIPP